MVPQLSVILDIPQIGVFGETCHTPFETFVSIFPGLGMALSMIVQFVIQSALGALPPDLSKTPFCHLYWHGPLHRNPKGPMR